MIVFFQIRISFLTHTLKLLSEIELLRLKESDEKIKLRSQLNQEKKLTEEAVKKLFQIVQEKKPKTGVLKNASETKRLEKEHKRLQMEVNKERENYAHMHKHLNQEIQSLKDDLEKREQEVQKLKELIANNALPQRFHINNNNHIFSLKRIRMFLSLFIKLFFLKLNQEFS